MGSEKIKVPFLKDRVKQAMKEKGMKQKDIARLLDRSHDTIKGIFKEQSHL